MRYIFVTGMGRSGTKWLANILNCIKNIDAIHEYTGDRQFLPLSWYCPGEIHTIPYFEKIKKRIENDFHKDFFIDVNPGLRYSVPELHKVFNPERVFHLVRFGPSVVRSIYTRRSVEKVQIMPKNRDELLWYWEVDRFKQICWNWTSNISKLISEDAQLIQFEKLLSDYDYFTKNLLEPWGFSLDYSIWERFITRKINKTRSKAYRYFYAKVKGKKYIGYKLPPYKKWTSDQKKIFQQICGEAMKKAGYVNFDI